MWENQLIKVGKKFKKWILLGLKNILKYDLNWEARGIFFIKKQAKNIFYIEFKETKFLRSLTV